MDVLKPRWTSSTFLLYLGAFTVLGAAVSAYAYLSALYGKAAFTGWTALMLAILLLIAVFFRRRGAWITGGLFAYLSVTAFGTFVGALFEWWGWNGGNQNAPFDGWNWAEWALIALVLAAALAALAVYRFPLLILPIATLFWFLVTDIVSGGGSWSAVVTLAFGGFYFLVGAAVDRSRLRPYGFWLQVVSGLLIGGALLYWWHSSTLDWWLVTVVAVVFVGVGTAVRRSSWAVLGAAGLLAAATHFSIDWTNGSFSLSQGPVREWVPIVVAAVLGFLYVLLGLLAARRQEPPEAVAVPAAPTPPLASTAAAAEPPVE